MLDLPGNRLIPDKPPFSNVGIDFFCPLYVEQDSWKLWCLLSCLIIRAIHIKVTESFETDSFISGLCIFTRKRETPKMIRSDNGMNSSGREREIRKASNNWNKQKIEVFLHQKNIKWKFNFSGASHVGGVWERMIRLVRKILRVLLRQGLVLERRCERWWQQLRKFSMVDHWLPTVAVLLIQNLWLLTICYLDRI